MVAARDMVGNEGHSAKALPHDELQALLKRYGRAGDDAEVTAVPVEQPLRAVLEVARDRDGVVFARVDHEPRRHVLRFQRLVHLHRADAGHVLVELLAEEERRRLDAVRVQERVARAVVGLAVSSTAAPSSCSYSRMYMSLPYMPYMFPDARAARRRP